MNYEEIRRALAIDAGGTVTIGPGKLTANIDQLLTSANAGQPIVIRGARSMENASPQTVAIQGTATFLNAPDLPVSLNAVPGGDGDVVLTMRFTLLGPAPSPGKWKFSTSLPALPKVLDWSEYQPVLPLDRLALTDSYFILASHPGTDSQFQVPCAAGINFVGQLQPTGIVGIAESVFGKSAPSTIYGPVAMAAAAPLVGSKDRWSTTESFPGVRLRAELGVQKTWGSLAFGPIALRMYSPPSRDWLAANPYYPPVLEYTGTLQIPSAGLRLDVTAPVDVGAEHLMLFGAFKGVTLSKLGDLLDLTGSADLQSMLPDELKSAGQALGKLELLGAGLEMDWSRGAPTVDLITATVGIPDLRWKVWDDHFVIDSVAAKFDVSDPFSKPKYDVAVMGRLQIEGVPVNVRAASAGGFTVYAETAGPQTIPLHSLMTTYVPGVPAPADLTVNALRVSIAPFKSYSMAVALAQDRNPWVLDVGFQTLTISNVTLAVTYPRGGPVGGFFGGTIAFGNSASLTVTYSIPGALSVRGTFPEMRLSTLLSTLCNEPVSLPGGFDLAFQESYALIQYSGANLQFLFGTKLQGFGSFAFEARKNGAQWGFAAGLNIEGGDASQLGGLSVVREFQEYFGLQKLLLIVSSFSDPQFTFPDMAVFNAQAIGGGQLSLPATGMIAGVNFYGEWVIDTSKREQKLLRQLLGLNPRLQITLQLGKNPAQEARLYLSYSTKIEGLPLVCKFGGQIQGGKIGIFLEGTITVTIQGQTQIFSVRLDIVANGALLAATMSGNTPITISFEGVEVFKIGNLAIAIGIDWEGIPSAGVAGSLEIQGIESSIAVFFDSTQPSNSLVAGSLSDISLETILNTMTGQLARAAVPAELLGVLDKVALSGTNRFTVPGSIAPDLDDLKLDSLAKACAEKGVTIPSVLTSVYFVRATAGSVWYLTDLTNQMRHYQLRKSGNDIEVSQEAQLYCAPQRTQIGGAPHPYDPGFFLTGALNLFGFRAMVTVDVNPNKGIAVEGSTDKLVIADEKLFSIKAAEGDGGPRLSASTFTQPEKTDPQLRDPHFYVNGSLTLLGLSRDVYAKVSTSGIEFDLKGEMLSLVYLDLHGNVAGPSLVGVGGEMRVGVGVIDLGVLGKIDLGTRVQGKLAISIGADSFVDIEGGFRFAGEGFDLPKLHVSASTSFFAGLAELIFEKVKEILLAFLADAARWAALVAQKVITGVEDVVKVLQEHFQKTLQEAQAIAQSAIDMAQKICSATRAAAAL